MRVGSSHRSTERGAVLFAGMFGIIVLLALGALVVDLLRMERIGRSLQRAADAASLAASLHLKGDPYSPPADFAMTKSGWRKAKRAAILAFRNNLIAEGGNEIATATGWAPEGTSDHWEVPSTEGNINIYYRNEIRLGKLRYTIERGAWLYQEGQEPEGGGTDGIPGTGPYFVPLESQNGYCPVVCNVENHRGANAVRVRVQMTTMRSFFPLAWAGTADIGALSREAIGANYPQD